MHEIFEAGCSAANNRSIKKNNIISSDNFHKSHLVW